MSLEPMPKYLGGELSSVLEPAIMTVLAGASRGLRKSLFSRLLRQDPVDSEPVSGPLA